jgi:uncharacterized protein (DUF1015 family)
VANFKPFPALRPSAEAAPRLACPPYDVMSEEEAREMADGNPLSFLHVTRPEINFDPGTDPHLPFVYERGARELRRLVTDGHLARDPKPYYYIYRQIMGDHSQTGIVGAGSTAEYEQNVIKKHELTRPDKEDDRKEHIQIVGAQTGPVFLTYQADAEIDALVNAQCAKAPVYDFKAPDGVQHTAWVVDDEEAVQWIVEAFKEVESLYIADGHHRSAAAARAANERAAANPQHRGTEPYNYFLAVAFPHNQLQILSYNRVVKDLNGRTPEEFLEALREFAKVEEPAFGAPMPTPDRTGEICMYLDRKWYKVWLLPDPRTPLSVVSCLDVSLLQMQVLTPLLNIENPRTDKRITFVGGIRGTRELEKLVDSGQWAVAFHMHPTRVEELMAVADADELMPPKSTWFEPKLRDGLFCHIIGQPRKD